MKEVAEMNAGACATYFNPFHAVRVVFVQGNGVFHRFEETGPPRSAFKFGIAVKERCACDRVDKSSWAFFIQVGCGKRRLSALLEGDFFVARATAVESPAISRN